MKINEFGEIVRDDEDLKGSNLNIPTFTPPTTPVVEPVSLAELNAMKKEFEPKKVSPNYSKESPEKQVNESYSSAEAENE